ncbi:MAG: Gfo/Idh/MocA family oxidoreductase [Chloroflexota bacterium]
MNPVNFGIIGCGVIGTVHIKSVQDVAHVNIVAIADIRENIVQATAGEYGIQTAYTDAEALLADPDIEAVVLALPAHARTDLALRAFQHRKHVLTEKPVALNAGEVQQMMAAQGDFVAGCCSARFHALPATQAATDFIATGALGNLRVIRCRAITQAKPTPEKIPPNWRLSKSLNGGGIMSNWGCYDLDYLLGITGWQLQPQTVFGQTWTVPDPLASQVTPNSDAETHLTALIRCSNGCVITYERGEYVAAPASAEWEIIGETGSLTLQMTPHQNKALTFHKPDPIAGTISETIWQGDDSYLSVHPGPMTNFAEAIRTGQPPQTSLERALIIQEITDAIYASAETGEAIHIQA